MPSELNLSSLKPAQKRVARKRVGRGMGSGKGRYAGRGIKGQKSRAGSHKMPAGFEGGQTRLYMRLPKLPGNTSKDAMPIGPFRTYTQGVNVRDLERVFDAGAEVTPESLKAKRLIRTTRIDVKILGQGELTKKLDDLGPRRLEVRAREDRRRRRHASRCCASRRSESESGTRRLPARQRPRRRPQAAEEAEDSAEEGEPSRLSPRPPSPTPTRNSPCSPG